MTCTSGMGWQSELSVRQGLPYWADTMVTVEQAMTGAAFLDDHSHGLAWQGMAAGSQGSASPQE